MQRALILAVVLVTVVERADAQFRRGLMQDSVEITLYPHEAPALLMPAGAVEIAARNASAASARIVSQLEDLLGRQLTDNDERLQLVEKGNGVIVTATLIEWKESRRNSTKYVSERRQVGTRQVREKNGTIKTEPVYEYGRNKPSVVIDASAGMRVEVRRRAGGPPLADETARHTVQEEHLVEAGPPSREAVEDMLIDNVVRKAAARISPGRNPVRVLLARSDEVDRFNDLARNRRWHEWLAALEQTRPHRDARRDAYRLHNIAVANESLAYESTSVEDWNTRLGLARRAIGLAAEQNSTERYIKESSERIAGSVAAYQRLAGLYAAAGVAPSRRNEPGARPLGVLSTSDQRAPAVSPRSATLLANQDVIDLRAAGLDDDNLIAAINEAKQVKFDLSAAGLKALLSAKVSNRVIAAMRAKAAK